MGTSIATALLLFAADDGGAAPPACGSGYSLLPFLVIMVLFYLLLIRPQRREQSKREDMMKGLKPNDRVITIGGIYGVVTNVHREADSVTIRVDEKNDTKIRVTLGAIARILGEETTPNEPSK